MQVSLLSAGSASVLVVVLAGCGAPPAASSPAASPSPSVERRAPANETRPGGWLDVVERHGPSLAEKLRDCAAGDCEADAFSWCEWRVGAKAPDWTAYECSYRDPADGSVQVTRRDERLEAITILFRQDFAPMFEALASLPSAEVRGDELEIAVGPTTQLWTSRKGFLTLYKVTPLARLPEVLDSMRAEGNGARVLRPTRLHLQRGDFIFDGYREGSGSTAKEAGYTCIPVWQPGQDAAVMEALAGRWGHGHDEPIDLFGDEIEARVFESGWLVVDLRRHSSLEPPRQLLIFYSLPTSALGALGPHCEPDG